MRYLIEIKEKNSSNMFLITVNENLYFKIWSPFQSPPQKVIPYWCLKVRMYWWLFLKQTSNALRGTHILYLWNSSFIWLKPSLKNLSSIAMFLGFSNTKESNNRKWLPHNNLSFFWGNTYSSIFMKNRTPTTIPFVKGGRSNCD